MKMTGLVGSALAALTAMPANGQTKIYGFNAIHRHLHRSRVRKGSTNTIALVNRHTGKPHEHKREIARRLRQGGASL